MSVRINPSSQKSRPYKIEVYGLQDNYIGTLQSFNDSFIGQIIEPQIQISDDGTQTFTCSIPKFYIDPETNLKLENPRWVDTNNGVLAENTRILKVFIKDEESKEDKIYPFIVDKITDKRDSHFTIYREIECSGLAFAELGKVGYKLELNSYTIESENEKDNTILPTINYWLDKVFPNVKNEDGEIIKWLTPWCYEIRMDWSHYSVERDPSKMYDDPYVTSWVVETTSEGNEVTSEKLVSGGYNKGWEKARYIDCKNSNKYNITQSIAEAFEVFCQYEYKCDTRGRFIREYEDETGVWTGRKVVFFNRAIKTDNPAIIEYKKNLNDIQRTKDSSEVYTKLYVTPIESSVTDTGYISIADTALNPTLDDFILNFDYLYQTNAISNYQLNFIKTYEVETFKINSDLINLSPEIESLTAEINDLESKLQMVNNEVEVAKKNLVEYETLASNEVLNTSVQKNKDNSFSVVFVEDGDIKKAAIRLFGVDKTSITGYSNYKYNKVIFPLPAQGINIVTTTEIIVPPESSKDFYLVLDEFGYPTTIYTHINNSEPFSKDNSSIIYLSLEYNPKNAYEDICDQLERRILNKQASAITLESSLAQKRKLLESDSEPLGLQVVYNNLLEQKQILNQKLEKVLGPALREGYWTPDTSYEDYGQFVEKQGQELSFDTIPFEGEQLSYYYASIEGQTDNKKTYYPYINISAIYAGWADKKIENLVLRLSGGDSNLIPSYVLTEDWQGNYKINYDNVEYYFIINKAISKGTTVNLDIVGTRLYLIYDGNKIRGEKGLSLTATDITDHFMKKDDNIPTPKIYERVLYNNAGFVFAFKQEQGTVCPILLLDNLDIDYTKYTKVTYSFDGNTFKDNSNFVITNNNVEYSLCYPRIIIEDSNVNYKSDTLKIINYTGEYKEEEFPALTNYEDYSILIRSGKPHITFKVTNENNLTNILDNSHYIQYRISRANEMLYLDAKNIARDNAYPKYSYELKIANIPNFIDFYELGQLVYINDYSMGIHAASGYISGITMQLNKPQDDEIEVKNYKTKFEDLFSTITASSEAMRNNQVAYNIAASGFNPDGTIQGSILQNSILNNTIAMNYSKTNVEIDDVNGIVLTNQQPYLNGVYGQVKLTGGGIFLSNSVDSAGARIWDTGITPNGINAGMINAGQLDVEKIRVFAGDNVAFQWNGEGIFAYKRDENGNPILNTYVHYSDKGLQFVSGSQTAVDLGWNGLLISAQDGSTELSGNLGLTIYDGIPNKDNEGIPLNPIIRIGKFEESEQVDYGLKFYKKEEENKYVPTLVTTNNGELWLKDILSVGDPAQITWTDEDGTEHISNCIAGISGIKETYLNEEDGKTYVATDSVRFWAGRDVTMMNVAPFRVLQDGTLWATQANITGDIKATKITANNGTIGGWKINENSLSSVDGKTNLYSSGNDKRININNNFIVDADGTMTANGATISGSIIAEGCQIGGLTVNQVTNAVGAVGDITANMNNIMVEITSSNGNITKYEEEFTTIFTANIKKGGIILNDDEHKKYEYEWQYSDDGVDWTIFSEQNIYNRTINYSYSHVAKRYIKCLVHKKEDNNDDLA